jgi:segregation and condensation protein A
MSLNLDLQEGQSFDGPLDLLLYLIKRNEVDLDDIPMSLITEQYLEHLRLMEPLDLDTAGDFLLMASTLANIKSRILLPLPDPLAEEGEEGQGGEEEDPRLALVRPLMEYARFRQLAELLGDRFILDRDVFTRGMPNDFADEPVPDEPPVRVSLFVLVEAWRGLAGRAAKVPRGINFRVEAMTIGDKLKAVKAFLIEAGSGHFMDLLGRGRTETVVVTDYVPEEGDSEDLGEGVRLEDGLAAVPSGPGGGDFREFQDSGPEDVADGFREDFQDGFRRNFPDGAAALLPALPALPGSWLPRATGEAIPGHRSPHGFLPGPSDGIPDAPVAQDAPDAADTPDILDALDTSNALPAQDAQDTGAILNIPGYPEAADVPGASDVLDALDAPNGANALAAQDKPDGADATDIPGVPQAADPLAAHDDAGAADAPNFPGSPQADDALATQDIAGVADTSDIPDAPGVPDTPDGAHAQNLRGPSEDPDAPEAPGSPESPDPALLSVLSLAAPGPPPDLPALPGHMAAYPPPPKAAALMTPDDLPPRDPFRDPGQDAGAGGGSEDGSAAGAPDFPAGMDDVLDGELCPDGWKSPDGELAPGAGLPPGGDSPPDCWADDPLRPDVPITDTWDAALSFIAVLELARTGFLRLYQDTELDARGPSLFLANPDAEDSEELDYR